MGGRAAWFDLGSGLRAQVFWGLGLTLNPKAGLGFGVWGLGFGV